MKKTVLASAVLLAMAGAASATPDFGTITIDGKTADSSALATETNGIVKIEVHLGSPWNAALTFKKKSGRLPPRKK